MVYENSYMETMTSFGGSAKYNGKVPRCIVGILSSKVSETVIPVLRTIGIAASSGSNEKRGDKTVEETNEAPPQKTLQNVTSFIFKDI